MTATKVSATELFRAAYENRYTWDADFPGYTADITYNYDGKTITGKVQISSNYKAEVTGVESEEAQKAIHGQAWESLFTVYVEPLNKPMAKIFLIMALPMKLVLSKLSWVVRQKETNINSVTMKFV
jgi:hypothetical protein